MVIVTIGYTMKIREIGLVLAVTSSVCVSACSSGSGGGGGLGGMAGGTAGSSAGGIAGSGGAIGSGGVPGKGGVSGSGGNSVSGGSTASGGSAGAGGVSPAGGTTGPGGSTARGGATGTGGTAGSGGASSGAAGSGGSTANGGTTGAGGTTNAGGTTGSGGTTPSTGSGGTGAGGSGAGGVTGRDAGAGGNTSAGGASGRDAGTGADGNTATYQPCPSNGNPCKILPLGDSITYGVNDEGNAGYRGPLFASAVAAGQKITFTGSLSNGPNTVSGQTFPRNNEGHSGWGISEVTPYSNGNAGIATVIPNPSLSSGSGGMPNIVLLHIGTNDSGSFSATQMTSDLKGLLDKIVTNAPDALLVVAQIIPLGYGTNDVIKAYNQAIPGLVQQLVTDNKHVVLVDMYTGFAPSTMLGSDSIHPNTTGYKFMADHWYSIIGSLLPK